MGTSVRSFEAPLLTPSSLRSPPDVCAGTAGIGQELGALPAQERRDAADANARRGGLLCGKREARKNKAEHLGGSQPHCAGQVPVDREGAVLRRRLHRGRRRHRARCASARLRDGSYQYQGRTREYATTYTAHLPVVHGDDGPGIHQARRSSVFPFHV